MAGLYIHVPFCMQRCVYCDFYFVTGQRDHSAFVEALCMELGQAARRGFNETVATIYLGGGTPSRLASCDIARILAATNSAFDTSRVTEVTIELNPEDTTAPYLRELRELGINRVSLGIQSFFDDDLRFMNRSHNASEATRALELVAESDLDSYSVDLIFGLPKQSRARWAANLDRLAAFGPPHVSTYALTIEAKTPLHKQVARGLVTPVAGETMAALYQTTMDTLRECGLEHYEISSFSKPGHRARHNQRYWTHANYLGFGPSAHSFWWDRTSAAQRWSNVRNLRKYLSLVRSSKDATDSRETLTLETLGAERIMLGLRTAEGVEMSVLKDIYGIDLMTVNGKAIKSLVQAGLLSCADGFLRLTDRGKHVCDSVTTRLLPPS